MSAWQRCAKPPRSDGAPRCSPCPRGSGSGVAEDLMAAPRPSSLREWRAVVFAPVGDGQRRRRGSDGARLALAVLGLVLCLLVIHYDSRVDRAIAQVINPPPRSITWLVTVVYQVGSYGVGDRADPAGPGRAPLGGGPRHRAERRSHRRGERDPRPGAGQPRRPPARHRDRRLLPELPGPAARPVHRGRHRGPALPGPGRAAPHRDLHRPGRAGLSRRRARAAAQRAGQPGHRLGRDGRGPAGLRLAARPAVDR